MSNFLESNKFQYHLTKVIRSLFKMSPSRKSSNVVILDKSNA